MIRTKDESGTGNVVKVARHMRTMNEDFQRVVNASKERLMTLAKEFNASYDLIKYILEKKIFPVVNFAAGGIATTADQL